MWLLNELLSPKPSVYNVNICLRLKGDLNTGCAPARAEHAVVDRHEALRNQQYVVSDGVLSRSSEPLARSIFGYMGSDVRCLGAGPRSRVEPDLASRSVRRTFDLQRLIH